MRNKYDKSLCSISFTFFWLEPKESNKEKFKTVWLLAKNHCWNLNCPNSRINFIHKNSKVIRINTNISIWWVYMCTCTAKWNIIILKNLFLCACQCVGGKIFQVQDYQCCHKKIMKRMWRWEHDIGVSAGKFKCAKLFKQLC